MSPSSDMEPVDDAGEDVEMSGDRDMLAMDMREADLAVCSGGEKRCTENQDGVEICLDDGTGFELQVDCEDGLLCDPEEVSCREPCEISPATIACGVERVFPPNNMGSACLGASLIELGDVVIAGDPCFVGNAGTDEGRISFVSAAFGNTWPQTGALTARARAGAALASIDDWVVVGVPGASSGNKEQVGDVRIFAIESNGSVTPGCEILAPEPHDNGHFGASIATLPSMGLILIGEPGYPSDSKPMGAVHVYRFENCENHSSEPDLTIRLPEAESGPSAPINFGSSIAATATADEQEPTARILVGAPDAGGRSAVFRSDITDGAVFEATPPRRLFIESEDQNPEGLGVSVKLDSTGNIGLVESQSAAGDRALYSIYFDDIAPRLSSQTPAGGTHLASAFGDGDRVWIASGDPNDPELPLQLSLHIPRPPTWLTERSIFASECRVTDMTPPTHPLVLLESSGGDSLIIGCPMNFEENTPTGAVFRYDFAPLAP